MEFFYDIQCPECGTTASLGELDRFFSCPSCGARRYLKQDMARYVLPAGTVPDGSDILYLPYLRIKGQTYVCHADGVEGKNMDTTQLGCAGAYLPQSLELASHDLQLEPLGEKRRGRFFHLTRNLGEIFAAATQRLGLFPAAADATWHRFFVGEKVSFIYLPTFVQDGCLMDGMQQRKLLSGFRSEMVEKLTTDRSEGWIPRLLTPRCPDCGEWLTGERDSLVLFCRRCSTLWMEKCGAFEQVRGQIVAGEGNSFLPFWHLTLLCNGVALAGELFADTSVNTCADSAQARLVQTCQGRQLFSCWVPAQRMAPESFLPLAKGITMNQEKIPVQRGAWRQDLPAVTLPLAEAIQASKVVMAALAEDKAAFFSLLSRLQLEVQQSQLFYLPLMECGERGENRVQSHTQVVVPKRGR